MMNIGNPSIESFCWDYFLYIT